jgi:two-component system sensor histidine kinase DctS
MPEPGAGPLPVAAEPARDGPRREGASLWRSSTAGALLAIALLVAATVGAALWLSLIDDQRQLQAQLVRQAHQAALQIRNRLIETEQMLLVEGSGHAASESRLRRKMVELLAANPALLRIELRQRTGGIAWAIDAPPPRPSLPAPLRARLGAEATDAFETASRLSRLTYSRPYYLMAGSTGFELMELVVPTGEVDGPMIVAIYSPQRILDHFLSAGTAPGPLFSLVEPDGTFTARQPQLGQVRLGQHALSPLARAGTTLQVRVDAVQGGPRLIPNLLTSLVAATSVGLGLAMFFLIRDIRERARVERALRDQVRFRHAVEDAMLHALGVFDRSGRVIQVNAALCRITGYSQHELIGRRTPLPFVPDEARQDYDDYLARIEAAAEPERAAVRARGFETVYRHRDGHPIHVLVVETPVQDADGAPIGRMVVGVDITEQKRIEEIARRQQEILQSHSRLATLGEMASTLSHELNQPLAAITSYAAACENLIASRPARPDAVAQALRGIRTQAERAGQVIRSVQSFLRRRAVDRDEVDLAALVRGLEPLLRLQAARTGARIDFDIPAGTTVHADRIMLEQVLLNLTRNGFEAMSDTPALDRVLALRARPVRDDERGERVEVSVSDRGRGVPPDALPQLFNAFFTTKTDGMGLGLSLCRSVIEQHGGSLQYRPGPRGGSVFAFDLPTAIEGVETEGGRRPTRGVSS